MVIYDMIWYSVAQSRIKYYSAIANVQIMRDRESQKDPNRARERERESQRANQRPRASESWPHIFSMHQHCFVAKW